MLKTERGMSLILIVQEGVFLCGQTHNRQFRVVFRGAHDTFLTPKFSW
jgi:hypothetical protein